MGIEFTCSGCRLRLTAPPTTVGKALQCPQCKKVITVPNGEQKPPEPPPPQRQRAIHTSDIDVTLAIFGGLILFGSLALLFFYQWVYKTSVPDLSGFGEVHNTGLL
jgi:hypothetical protein